MIDRGSRSLLGVNVGVVDYDAALAAIVSAARERRAFGVSALAVHGLMTGALNPEHKYRLNRLALLTPDGQPVRWALALLHGEALPDRVYGPELTMRLCRRAEELGLSIYLFGSRPEVLADWQKNLRRACPRLAIAGTESSKFRNLSPLEVDEVNSRIIASGADIVLIGLGCPRQEVFVFEHAEALSRPVLAVGAAFDFHAGRLRQAPRWMQDSGLEWLFRLVIEPQRLWRRYLLLNPLFCILLLTQFVMGEKPFLSERRPRGTVRYG